MKKKISAFLSKNLPGLWKWYMRKKKKYKFGGKTNEEVFKHIYKSNMWSSTESVSGAGSTLSETVFLRNEITGLTARHGIRSVADVPCGDFNWMKLIVHEFGSYVGGDIVDELVDANNQKYASDKVSFRKIDLTTTALPKSDLLLVRDCLVHLSYQDITRALRNIAASEIKWLLTTHFVDVENHDITTGDWRPINLCAAPFHFPEPVFKFKDSAINDKKTLALWKIEDIRACMHTVLSEPIPDIRA